MKKAKLLSLMVAATMALSISGCAGTKATKTPAASDKTKERTESVKVSILGISWGAKLPAADADFIKEKILKDIKIDIDMSVVDGADDIKNQLNLKIASGSTPDMFSIMDKVQFNTLAEKGALLEIDPYYNKLADYKKFVGENALKTTIYNGKSYGIAKQPAPNGNGVWIRKDWLNKLNLKVPTTVDEFYDVAKAFVENDPDGNNKKDTIGITGRGNPIGNVFLAYGVPHYNDVMIKDNKAILSILEPGFKQGLEQTKRFIDAGLVDPEFLMNKQAVVVNKAYQGKVGIINEMWGTFTRDENVPKVTAADPKAEWVQMEGLKGPGGQYIVSYDQGGTPGFALSKELSKKPDKLQAVLDLVNYVSSPDGSKLVMYGIKDKHWTEENGKISMTESGPTATASSWLYQFSGRPELEYLGVKFSKQKSYIDFNAKQPVLKTYTSLVNNPATYNSTDAGTYFNQEFAKFIYGKRPISEYDAFIKTMKDTYGLQSYVDEANKQLKELGYIK